MRCDAGIMISASHNSFEDNGIKFFDSFGDKLSCDVEKQIEAIYNDSEMLRDSYAVAKNIGKAKRIDDVIGRYIIQLKNSFPKEISLKGMRIVLDTANGAGYKVGPTVLEELDADLIVINDNPDGYNINESCGALDTRGLCEKVKTHRADLGIALDGDADRLVIVDENGEVVDGDQLLGAVASYMYEQGTLKGDGVVATVMSNQGLEDFMIQKGLKLYRSAVGDKKVLEIMKKENINFGGEQSGHIIISDFAKTGDGLLTALQVLSLLIDTKQKASEALRPFSLYPQKLVNIKVKNKKDLKTIDGLDEKLEELDKKGVRHLIRYSGTENKLRILLECKDLKIVNKEMDDMVYFFEKALNA
jgi:phosphoglucosamine mutase